jgi:uncharacterized protein (DUF433 family)
MNNLKFGTGIFSVSEASLFLGLPGYKVRRWINEIWNTRIIPTNDETYSWGDGRDRSLSFLTLIEFYVFYQLRNQNISVNKIVLAHKVIQDRLKTSFPFANASILTDGCTVLFRENESIIDAEPGLQTNIQGIILPFCKKIEFGDDSLAKRFWPKGRAVNIIIDPEHQFGQPTIPGTNILARQLYNLHKGGESLKFISSLYHLPTKVVKDAISIFN